MIKIQLTGSGDQKGLITWKTMELLSLEKYNIRNRKLKHKFLISYDIICYSTTVTKTDINLNIIFAKIGISQAFCLMMVDS